jgi:hypothetical protein
MRTTPPLGVCSNSSSKIFSGVCNVDSERVGVLANEQQLGSFRVVEEIRDHRRIAAAGRCVRSDRPVYALAGAGGVANDRDQARRRCKRIPVCSAFYSQV